MKKILILLISTIMFFTGCTEDTLLSPASDQIVVRGYIYSGEPVSDIQITKTLALGSEETKAPPVNDAVVLLVKADQSYPLTRSAGDSGYYHYPGTDLAIESGDEFEIRVEYNGEVTTGKTVVPFPPENLTASANELIIPTTFVRGTPFNDSTGSIFLHWKEDAASLFYIVIECIEENPIEVTGFGGSGQFKRRFVFPPTNNNEYRIARFGISYYGDHIARVYRVNQEYADLYASRDQDSRDLNEPLTNIQNGLGVFSAFASRTVSFRVVTE